MSAVQQPGVPGRQGPFRRGWLASGGVLLGLGVVLPVSFVALAFGRLQAGGEMSHPTGPGAATVVLREGYGYDVLGRDPGDSADRCQVTAPDGRTSEVPVRAGSTRWGSSGGDLEDGDDVPPGSWYVVGWFTAPVQGESVVECDGTVAAGELALLPDDDVYGGLALSVLGGGLLGVAGIGCLLVGLLWRRPGAAPGPYAVPVPPAGYAPGSSTGSYPAPAAPAAPVAAAPTAPWDQPREPAPWERPPVAAPPATAPSPAPAAPADEQPADHRPPAWQPRAWQPPAWSPPDAARTSPPQDG